MKNYAPMILIVFLTGCATIHDWTEPKIEEVVVVEPVVPEGPPAAPPIVFGQRVAATGDENLRLEMSMEYCTMEPEPEKGVFSIVCTEPAGEVVE